ncbi:biotin transporter BioY [Bosea sp. 685]|uniref:biotin transporter BioY n=1 Tax=Bosea sp. 685 TaxID=3080057 RepID=UPI0028933689|nr:biotin transporter BioY [Bosea sp. 685]WNJ87909.1 biotin transporter BioY [Bosea sp. 685]
MTQEASSHYSEATVAPASASVLRAVAIAFAGSLLLALASRIAVPMFPVPMTLQTYAVLLLGAMLGWRRAGLSVAFYLVEAAMGFPVLANGASGALRLIGPTGGYLLAFPVAAMAVGLAMCGSLPQNRLRTFALMMAGHAAILAAGSAWLATTLGWETAIAVGVTPFLLGSVVKSALVVVTVEALGGARRHLSA